MNENIKLIITVDTEADNEWKNIKNLSTKNIAYLSKFQVLCQKYNIPPTYLVTYTVAQDKQAVNMLFKWQKDGVAEIGAHLHPWANPPFFEMDEYQSFPSELHPAIIKKKLEILTKTIEEKFKQKPTSYRAGRWGFGENQLKILKDLGYLVDCSVSPKVSWKKYIGKSGGEGGPDFRLYSVKPFFWSNGLLEVPMTIVFTGLLKQEDTKIATYFLKMKDGYRKKIINKLFFQQKWLRIFSNSKKKDCEKIFQAALKNKVPVLEFMIHSSELMPGASPYAKTKEAVENIYVQIETMFQYFQSQGIEGITLSDFAKYYDKKLNI